MDKNGEYEGIVAGLGTDGEGIIKIQGTTAFVPFCLTGEKVRFKAVKVKGNIAYGKLLKVITPSYSRVNAPCGVFGRCGGCDLQHMDYAEQLKFKKESVENALSKIGGIYARVNGTVACDGQYGYRNKLALPIGVEDGKTVIGFYARRSHRIVPANNCAIQAEWSEKVFDALYSYVNSGVSGYDEVTRNGELRHFVARGIGGKYIFALVSAKAVDVSYLLALLDKYFKDYTFLLNINDSRDNVIFGDDWRICRGEGFFEAEENSVKFKAGANTFLQVNDEMRSKLYNAVLAEAEGSVAVDLYSGGGMLTAMLARKCGLAYGIEVVEEASRCADELKTANGLDGVMFNVCGKVEDEIGGVFEKTAGKSRVIVCDPPRKGMERSVVRAIASSGADKIILVSCNPATLARDLGLLLGTLAEKDGGLVKVENALPQYVIKSITPFDMFPQTKWCETLVVLSHKKPDGHINIKVEFGEEEGQVSLKEVAKRAEERKPK